MQARIVHLRDRDVVGEKTAESRELAEARLVFEYVVEDAADRPWRSNPTWLEGYAWDRRDHLLQEKGEIFAVDAERLSHPLFGPMLARLKATDRELFDRIRWRARVTRIAESLPARGSAKGHMFEALRRAELAQEVKLKRMALSRDRYFAVADIAKSFVDRFGPQAGGRHFSAWSKLWRDEEGNEDDD